MRYDLENQLSVAQAFTGAATVSTNSYQKQNAADDPSIGRRLALLIIPTVAAGTGSTHTMECVQADNTALTTNLAVVATKSILAAALTVGSYHELPIPQGSLDQLHIGFRNSSTGGTTTVTLDVYLVPQDEIEKFKSFPRGPVSLA